MLELEDEPTRKAVADQLVTLAKFAARHKAYSSASLHDAQALTDAGISGPSVLSTRNALKFDVWPKSNEEGPCAVEGRAGHVEMRRFERQGRNCPGGNGLLIDHHAGEKTAYDPRRTILSLMTSSIAGKVRNATSGKFGSLASRGVRHQPSFGGSPRCQPDNVVNLMDALRESSENIWQGTPDG